MKIPALDIEPVRSHDWLASFEHHFTLGSTNARAREAAGHNPPLPLLVVADGQTAGRGRGANRWWTGRGSLVMSLLFDPATLGIAADQRTGVSLAAAVAVVDAVGPLLDGVVPQGELGLHWPNDVFVSQRKLAGALVETLFDGRLILGLGVNTNNTAADAPPELRRRAVTLRDLTEKTHDPTQFLIRLLAHLRECLEQLGHDPDLLGERFARLCLQRGRVVTVQQGTETTTGRCHDVAHDGALLLDTPHGRRAFYSGALVHE
ncbi:MAG: biotin--[acetyl-CoA-carboxylase] ligase [Planctomycetia bacterium]|nr:biotin--[acetyl-CoA-carboxylase] ligase [Planctomycetia bacterium]